VITPLGSEVNRVMKDWARGIPAASARACRKATITFVLERKESWERERDTVNLITTGGAGEGVGVVQAVGVWLALRAPMEAVGVGV
jgi:hypothetical protein